MKNSHAKYLILVNISLHLPAAKCVQIRFSKQMTELEVGRCIPFPSSELQVTIKVRFILIIKLEKLFLRNGF